MLMSLFHLPIVQIIEELNASNDIIIWSVTVMWMNVGILIKKTLLRYKQMWCDYNSDEM